MVASKPSLKTAKRSRWRWVGWTLLVGTIVGGLALAWAWSRWSREADAYLTFFAMRTPKTLTKVLDRNGDVIGVFAEERRMVIPYGDIPKAFVNALVASEDADFWTHGGVSTRGLLRAGWNFVTSFGRRREGASTLTMQLVRTVTGKRQKKLNRKIQEIILARKLEKAYTKKQILESYANEVYFGGGRYGIEAAAQFYFGKSAPQLNVEECALLVGILPNPNWYYPYSTNPRLRQQAFQRRNLVLNRMVAEGYLKPEDARILEQRPVRLARGNAAEEEVAPYAVEEVRKYLYEKYGRETVLTGGLEVHTTLDSVWQHAANEAVRKGLKAVDRRRGFRKDALQFVGDPETAELPGWNRVFETGDEVRGIVMGWQGDRALVRIGRQTLNVPREAFAWAGKDVVKLLPRGAVPLFQVKRVSPDGRPLELELDQEPEVEGALLAVEPSTGEIRAMVGGYDFRRSKFNRAFQAERQVGSTMKAFVYGAAFLLGQTPATMVEDAPVRYTFDATIYEPKNYERDFWGPIPIWEALRDSRNVPAVRTLEATGIEAMIAYARACGVSGFIRPYPSSALGASDLTLKDMVRGYATLANQGKQTPPLFLIRKIVDRNGRVLESHEGRSSEEPAVDPVSVFQLTQCLQGVAQRGTGARCNELDWPVAGKTGTTDDHTDAWFLGYSTRIACGVWVGLDTKKTIYRPGADGARVALPIWLDFMRVALPTTPREDFQAPEGLEWADIDRLTGLIATGATDPQDVVRLAFRPGTLPKAPSTSEARQEVRESRAKVNGKEPEHRIWGHVVPGTSEGEEPSPEALLHGLPKVP